MTPSERNRKNRADVRLFTRDNFEYQSDASMLPVITIVGILLVSPVFAAESSFPVTNISIAQQNEMMDKYCVLCHKDAAKNSELSLEHFNAATVSPAVAAILANKFTEGVPVEEILMAEMDPDIVEKIVGGKTVGAPSVMGIAGFPLPAEGEVNGFIMSMAARAQGAEQWHVVHDGDSISADVVRVLPVPSCPAGATHPVCIGKHDLMYRLALNCDAASGEGNMVVSWSPIPANGTVRAVVDDGEPLEFVLDEKEPMANTGQGGSSPSSVVLAGTGNKEKHPSLGLPTNNLEISGPFLRAGPVDFSFNDLGEPDRKMLNACFGK